MTITGRWNDLLALGRKPRFRVVPRVSSRSYERHVRSQAVQELIESARTRLRERDGTDPAAARLKSRAARLNRQP
jgi:hypothetical protein